MIFYFSATGNCHMVASAVAAENNDSCLSISECFQKQRFEFSVSDGEPLGFVTPTYFWGVPSLVREFLDKLILHGKPGYTYHITVYGTTSGQSSRQFAELLARKEMHVQASFSVQTVDTWTPIFDLTDAEKNQQLTGIAWEQAKTVGTMVRSRRIGDFVKRKVPNLLVGWYYGQYEEKRKTKHFVRLDRCSGCGLCEKNCPVNAIQIKNGKAEWILEQCVMCLGCLHHCPEFAIQYGRNTEKHGQFVNQKTGGKK